MKKLLAVILIACLVLSLAACGKEIGISAKEIYDKMTQAVALPEMLKLDESMMLDYCGIDAATTTGAEVVICADSLKTDEVWIVEATDEAAADEIVDLAKTRLNKKDEESIKYSPEQNAVVKQAQILRSGKYVMLLVSPDAQSMATALETITGASLEKVN